MCVSVCAEVHVCKSLWRQEQGVGSPRAVVIGTCELSSSILGTELGSLARAPCTLNQWTFVPDSSSLQFFRRLWSPDQYPAAFCKVTYKRNICSCSISLLLTNNSFHFTCAAPSFELVSLIYHFLVSNTFRVVPFRS